MLLITGNDNVVNYREMLLIIGVDYMEMLLITGVDYREILLITGKCC